MRLADYFRGDRLVRSALARYAFSIGMVALALGLRVLLTPWTGLGAPFVIFFAATLVTSLVAGVGPAFLTLALSLPIASAEFVLRAGYPVSQAVAQAALFALDGILLVYLTILIRRRGEDLRAANRQLQRADDERERTLTHVRETIELAPDAYFLADAKAFFVNVNEAACRLLGYDRDELIGKKIFDIITPEDAPRLKALNAELIASGGVSKSEWTLKRKNGTLVPTEVSTNGLPDGLWQAFARDISERKRAEEALRLSEAKFSGIVSIAADAIISVDEDQRISIFNEGAEEIFGYDRSEVIGTTLDRLIPERFRALHREHFARFAASDEAARKVNDRMDIIGLRKDGEEFPAEASISKVTVGGATLFSVVVRDITYRKSVEAALQQAISARDEVLGIVAHDLRNPLNTIMMQAELFEHLAPQPERQDRKPWLVITRAASRMERLIQDLLDVALVEAGRLTVERERLSAADLAREAMEMQAPLASSAGLELRLEVERDVGGVWGDRSRLLQVFENLIGNALKFTGKGGRITIGAMARDNEVEFFVADTGCGIAPESLPHVFDRFWRAKRTDRQGAGFGLTIAKGIVEAHGGRIRVESTMGRGTTFFFTIPTAPAEWRPSDALKLLGPGRSRAKRETSGNS
jgi:PAS domain S-box-containing protein